MNLVELVLLLVSSYIYLFFITCVGPQRRRRVPRHTASACRPPRRRRVPCRAASACRPRSRTRQWRRRQRRRRWRRRAGHPRRRTPSSVDPQFAAEDDDEDGAREGRAQRRAHLRELEHGGAPAAVPVRRGGVDPRCHETNGQQRDGEHDGDAVHHFGPGAPAADGVFGVGDYPNQGSTNDREQRQLESERRIILGSERG